MNWYKISQNNLRFENRHIDSIGSQWDYEHKYILIAWEGDQPRGYIEYSVFRDEYNIEMVFVGKEFRRQGIGTALWDELNRIANGAKVHSGMAVTDEGYEWGKYIHNPYRQYGT